MAPRRGWPLVLVALLFACTSELAVPTEPLRLLRPEWGVAYVGEAFNGSLRPAGGLRPYRFELADGALPPGLVLDSGRLVGTPTEVGRFTFTAQVQDGNLSQAILRVDVDVRPLPTPVVRVDAPATEVRGPVALLVRVEDARGWRGARVALRWDPERFELDGSPTTGDGRLALFHEGGEGLLLLEAAALGPARQGAFTLARLSLRPLVEPTRLNLEVVATSRFAGGDHTGRRLEGAPAERPAVGAGEPPGDELPGDELPGDELPGDEPPGEGAPGDGAPDDEAPDDEAGPGDGSAPGDDDDEDEDDEETTP